MDKGEEKQAAFQAKQKVLARDKTALSVPEPGPALPGGVGGTPSKASSDGSDLPEREIIDLTIKEESRSVTPISPTQAPEPNEDPAELKAGCVSSSEVWIFAH